jgi:hypothetical protein
MNTPNEPFGDPTKVDRENARSVRKGVLFGCGGCAILAAVGVLAVAGIVAAVFALMRSDETVRITLEAAEKSPVLQREIGEPMTVGWLVTGDINRINDRGNVDLQVPIRGPAGEAKVHTVGERENGSWHFSLMEATIRATGQKVDLRPAP